MLKIILAAGPTASTEVGDEKQDGKGFQVDGNEKKPAQLV